MYNVQIHALSVILLYSDNGEDIFGRDDILQLAEMKKLIRLVEFCERHKIGHEDDLFRVFE